MIHWVALAALSPAQETNQPAPVAPERLKIDILVKQPVETCEANTGDEIVVCANKTDDEVHRLRPIPESAVYEKDESKAEFSISENVRIAAEVDSAQLGGGVTSKSIMARVKIKF